ncbi:MAG: PEP-CTERM sorting domain-containing protein [Planctomycetota bacterium]
MKTVTTQSSARWTVAAALGLSAATLGTASADVIDFTDDQSYTNGDIAGQNGWFRVFGPEPLFNVVDAGVSGGLDQVATGGAIARNFTDAEAGQAFDTNTSIVTYTIVFNTPAAHPTATFTGIGFGIGDTIFSTDVDLGIFLRDDGRIQIEDGVLTGNDRLLGDFDITPTSDTVTLTVSLDYSDNTYSASRSDSPTKDRVDFAFDPGATENPYFLRIDSSQPYDVVIDSISIETTAIPEPGSLVLLGLGGLALVGRRRKP